MSLPVPTAPASQGESWCHCPHPGLTLMPGTPVTSVCLPGDTHQGPPGFGHSCRAVSGPGTPLSWRWHREKTAGTLVPLAWWGSSVPVPTLTESQEHLVLLPLQVELVNSQEGVKLLLGYMGKDVLCQGRTAW